METRTEQLSQRFLTLNNQVVEEARLRGNQQMNTPHSTLLEDLESVFLLAKISESVGELEANVENVSLDNETKQFHIDQLKKIKTILEKRELPALKCTSEIVKICGFQDVTQPVSKPAPNASTMTIRINVPRSNNS
jgi:hypothetical protein